MPVLLVAWEPGRDVLDADHGKVAHIRATIATIKPLIATVMTDITGVADRSATLLVVYFT